MSSTLDIVVSAQDQASEVIEGVGESVEETAERTEVAWGAIGLGLAAAGAGAEAFARGQADSNATLARAAIATGETEEALRESAAAMSDHTFATEDAIEGMDGLIRRGIDTREEFEAILPKVDDLADATGMELVDAMESADRLLGPLGKSLHDVGDESDQMARIIAQTDVPMGTLERNLGRIPDELQDLEFGLDDVAAGVDVFRERGFEGREAVREFRRAVADSEGDMDALLERLGLTADEWEEYQAAAAPAEDLTRDLADANNDQMTVMEELQQRVGNLMTRYGGLAEAASIAAPALMGIGSAMGAVGSASRILGRALTFLAANPVGLIIAAVAAVVAGLVIAWNRSETFRDIVTGVFEKVGEVASWLWDNVLEPVWGFIRGGFELLADAASAYWDVWSEVFEKVADVVEWVWETVLQPIWGFIREGIDRIGEVVRGFVDLWQRQWEIVTDAATWVWESVLQPIWARVQRGLEILGDGVRGWARIFGAQWDIVTGVARWAWEDVIQPAWDAIAGGFEWLGDRAEDFRELWGEVMDRVVDGAKVIVNPIIGFFNAIIGGAESLVNSIARAINRIPSFTVPDWVPGMGGNEFSLPTVPTVDLPRIPELHDGGIFRAPRPGGEGLALLRDRERVSTPEAEGALLAEQQRTNRLLERLLGRSDADRETLRLLRRIADATESGRMLMVDGDALAELVDERLATA